MKQLHIIDSHSGGEPTRVIIDGGPDLGDGSMRERLSLLKDEHDALRTGSILEPRGSDVLVGALLCETTNPHYLGGVIFFNNAGYLGMCGHGIMGVAVTLAHMGRIEAGKHKLDTPVGEISFTLYNNHRVSVDNVPCYRYKKSIALTLPDKSVIHGDIAWGGNWFFLVADHGQTLDSNNTDSLSAYCTLVREQLEAQNITGENGALIDHIELFAAPSDAKKADSKNFVLCPGMVYDRSPCGTGTSAKLACLYADGALTLGDIWRQESIIGTVFEGRLRSGKNGTLLPTITGSAYVTGEGQLIFNEEDPFKQGV